MAMIIIPLDRSAALGLSGDGAAGVGLLSVACGPGLPLALGCRRNAHRAVLQRRFGPAARWARHAQMGLAVHRVGGGVALRPRRSSSRVVRHAALLRVFAGAPRGCAAPVAVASHDWCVLMWALSQNLGTHSGACPDAPGYWISGKVGSSCRRGWAAWRRQPACCCGTGGRSSSAACAHSSRTGRCAQAAATTSPATSAGAARSAGKPLSPTNYECRCGPVCRITRDSQGVAANTAGKSARPVKKGRVELRRVTTCTSLEPSHARCDDPPVGKLCRVPGCDARSEREFPALTP